MRSLIGNKQLLFLFASNLVVLFVGMGLFPLLPLYATQFGATRTVIGIYYAVMYAASVLGTMATGWLARRVPPRDLFIAAGFGAEGFVTDARAGRIRDAIGGVSVDEGSYSAGMLVGVWLLAEAFSEEFGFELTGQMPATVPASLRASTARRRTSASLSFRASESTVRASRPPTRPSS